jgi:hypothetical protein
MGYGDGRLLAQPNTSWLVKRLTAFIEKKIYQNTTITGYGGQKGGNWDGYGCVGTG